MYCSKCGKQIPDEADFCGYCGNKINKPIEVQKTTTSAQQKSWLKNPILLGSLAVAVVIAIVAAAIGFGGKSDKSSGNAINYEDAYSEILNTYKDCVQNLIVEEGTVNDCPWGALYDVSVWGSDLTSDDFGYAFSDINKSGIKELILYTRDYPMIFGIYSLQDGEPYPLREAATYRHYLSIRDDGTIVAGYSAGAGNSTTAAYILESNDIDLKMIEEYGAEDYGDGNRKSFRGFGGERTYYDGNDTSFEYNFESNISGEELELEFITILYYGSNETNDNSDIPDVDENGKPVFIETRKNGEYTYDVYDSYIELCIYWGNSKSVVVPSYIDGIPVKDIGANLFWSHEEIESITLPETITDIGWNSFGDCKKLKTINIPEGVTWIQNSAFNSCDSLTTITLPEGLEEIGSGSFSQCDNLTRVYIPDSVVDISDSTFEESNNVIIVCNQGSYAESYAKQNGIDYTYQ